MQKIVRVDYLHLRREEQHAFHDKVLQIVADTCGECGEPYKQMVDAAAEFDRILGEGIQSDRTNLMELDSVADAAWYSLHMQIKASILHPRASVREAAEKVSEVFMKTPNPTNLNYDQEYGSLKALLEQLDSLDESVHRAALVDEHIAALREAVDVFVNASTEKVKERSYKQVGEQKAAMNACFQAWQGLAKYLELSDQYGNLPGADNAIKLLNMMNNGIKRRLEARTDSGTTESSMNNVVRNQ